MKKIKELRELAKVLSEIDSTDDMLDFLKGILTSVELEEIPTRLQIVKMLKRGVPQHEIAKDLGIGVGTVTRGSKEIQKGRFRNING